MNQQYVPQFPPNNNNNNNYNKIENDQGDRDYDQDYDDQEPLKVAVISHQLPGKTIEVVEGQHHYEPRVVNLEAHRSYPVILNFESLLSPVQTSMSMINGDGDYGHGQQQQQQTYSVEGAHSHEHTVYRPIELRVNEVYTPFRHIFREVSPVEDSVKTFVHDEHQQPPPPSPHHEPDVYASAHPQDYHLHHHHR